VIFLRENKGLFEVFPTLSYRASGENEVDYLWENIAARITSMALLKQRESGIDLKDSNITYARYLEQVSEESQSHFKINDAGVALGTRLSPLV
jgi:two-component sensor histidine kinase